ncbi:MAG: hypothetical protein ACRDV9_00510 [Acidimicrobiia bacterium]
MSTESELVELLRGIDEELRDLAFFQLRDRGTSGLAEERRIHRARRAVARAIAILESASPPDSEDD